MFGRRFGSPGGKGRKGRGAEEFPHFQFVILSLCRIGEPIGITSIPLYLPAMLQSFHIPEHEIPYYASLCIFVYATALCISAPVWGWVADYWGRRPTILLALLIQIVSMLAFGFAQGLGWTVGMAGLLGMSSANSGTLRTVGAELVTDKEMQPKAFAILPMIWNIGSILGPLVGGALANPNLLYPSLMKGNAFFAVYPYTLPNLVVGTFLIAGLVIGLLFLQETLEPIKYRQDAFLRFGYHLSTRLHLELHSTNIHDYAPLSHEMEPLHFSETFSDSEDLIYHDKDTKSATSSPPKRTAIFTRQSTLNLIAHALLVTHSMIYDEFLPIFMFASKTTGITSPNRSRRSQTATDDVLDSDMLHFSGGIGLPTRQISLYFTFTAIYAVLIQLTLFPPLTRRLGPRICFRLASSLFPLVYFLIPFLTLLPSSETSSPSSSSGGWMIVPSIATILILKTTLTTFAFPCSMILLSNSASSMGVLGTLNGLATSTSALTRAIGAVVFGALLTAGLDGTSDGSDGGGNVAVAWWVLAGLAVGACVPVFGLVEKREEKDERPRAI